MCQLWLADRTGERRKEFAIRVTLEARISALGVANESTEEHIMTGQFNEGDDIMLTIAEAAEMVRSPVATLRYWRHQGIGPHSFRVGRSVRYWRSDVHNWLQEQSVHNSAAAS
jgi:predicted DNA-binding transcriptional regulator AlpA